MRCINQHQDTYDVEMDNEQQQIDCYDKEFARINRNIKATQKYTQRFNRISSVNKFRIKANDGSASVAQNNSGITYLDSVTEHLQNDKIKEESMQKLVNYLQNEHFDTESMDIDIGDGSLDGNISIFIANNDNKECWNSLVSIFIETKGMHLSVFSYKKTF